MPQMIKSVMKCKSLHGRGLKKRWGRFIALLIWTLCCQVLIPMGAANFTLAEIRITLDVKDNQKDLKKQSDVRNVFICIEFYKFTFIVYI